MGGMGEYETSRHQGILVLSAPGVGGWCLVKARSGETVTLFAQSVLNLGGLIMARSEYNNPNSLLSMHQGIGARGEEYVKDLMQGMGWDLSGIENWNASYDFTYDGKNIEVKTSYAHSSSNGQGTERDRYQFNMAAKLGIDDYLAILVLIDPNGTHFVYFVPGSAIQTKQVQITSHPDKYTGQYAKYLWNFEVAQTFLS